MTLPLRILDVLQQITLTIAANLEDAEATDLLRQLTEVGGYIYYTPSNRPGVLVALVRPDQITLSITTVDNEGMLKTWAALAEFLTGASSEITQTKDRLDALEAQLE